MLHSPHVNNSHVLLQSQLVIDWCVRAFLFQRFVSYLLWLIWTVAENIFSWRQARWRPDIDFRTLSRNSVQMFNARKDVRAYWHRRLCPPSPLHHLLLQPFPSAIFLRLFHNTTTIQRLQQRQSNNITATNLIYQHQFFTKIAMKQHTSEAKNFRFRRNSYATWKSNQPSFASVSSSVRAVLVDSCFVSLYDTRIQNGFEALEARFRNRPTTEAPKKKEIFIVGRKEIANIRRKKTANSPKMRFLV